MKYIPAEKLISKIEKLEKGLKSLMSKFYYATNYKEWEAELKGYNTVLSIITSLQQEKPEENKLPNKRTRVNYAICKLQSFKPLREAIVLDNYVYDEGKCYRENLLNYIHAIPERRLMEIRSYLKEKGWWPYDDDADWMEQKEAEVDLEKEIDACWKNWLSPSNQKEVEGVLPKTEFAMYARHFWNKGYNARKEE